jgi:hypothetical protein
VLPTVCHTGFSLSASDAWAITPGEQEGELRSGENQAEGLP